MFLKGSEVGMSQVVHGGQSWGVWIGQKVLYGVMKHFWKVVDRWSAGCLGEQI